MATNGVADMLLQPSTKGRKSVKKVLKKEDEVIARTASISLIRRPTPVKSNVSKSLTYVFKIVILT